MATMRVRPSWWVASGDELGLEGVALLLAGVVAALLAPRPLDRLLGAVDDQRLGLLGAHQDAPPHPQDLGGDPLDPVLAPADGALVHAIEATQEGLGEVAAVEDQQHQQMILQPAHAPGPAVLGLRRDHLPLPGGPQPPHHVLERVRRDPGQARELPPAPQPLIAEPSPGFHRKGPPLGPSALNQITPLSGTRPTFATGLFIRQALKSSMGEAAWLRFFTLMGTAIAFQERTSPVDGTPTDHDDLIDELRQCTRRLEVINKLETYGNALQFFETAQQLNAHYYLLELDANAKRVLVRPYKKTDLAVAQRDYLDVEKRIAVLPASDAALVSVDSVAALQRAYPNYSLDTRIFIDLLQDGLAGNPLAIEEPSRIIPSQAEVITK